MSKEQKVKQVDLEKIVMQKVRSDKISIRPHWYFVLGSLLTFAGFVGASIGAIFLTNITLFLLRRHGPMGQWKLQLMIDSFPLWVPLLAIIGILIGIWLLNKYDFSYKKNFLFIIAGFVLSIIIAAFVLDYMGLNDVWSRQNQMRRFYQRIEQDDIIYPQGQGRGYGKIRIR